MLEIMISYINLELIITLRKFYKLISKGIMHIISAAYLIIIYY